MRIGYKKRGQGYWYWSACDGQVLVLYDILNIGTGKRPRFSRNFMSDAANIEEAIHAYHQAVKQSLFPAVEHSF
jgi:3-methyl-2-oxobutanoate hydroxymethyltransferase